MLVAGVFGYLGGKMSYMKTCQEKFKSLENSPLGEALRQRQRPQPPVWAQHEQSTFKSVVCNYCATSIPKGFFYVPQKIFREMSFLFQNCLVPNIARFYLQKDFSPHSFISFLFLYISGLITRKWVIQIKLVLSRPFNLKIRRISHSPILVMSLPVTPCPPQLNMRLKWQAS